MSPGFRGKAAPGAYGPARATGTKALKDRQHKERAAYLRRLAKEAGTEALRQSCLKQAEIYEALAREEAEGDSVGQE
jgi:hypothetical protein